MKAAAKLIILTLVYMVPFSIGLKFVHKSTKGGSHFHSSPWLHINDGLVQGHMQEINLFKIKTFLGIPYAQPPIGDLRFKKPQRVESWGTQILDATSQPPPCMQHSNKKGFPWEPKDKPSEDCLYLNVWVPAELLHGSGLDLKNLPVMVFIYGGGYYSGATSIPLYDGAVLAAYTGIIVVSINYRVGSFGFLYSGTDDAPGNMGMYDQVMALQWVRDNIRKFGGNPSRVTLFGQSAGAVSIGLHMLSPLSTDLFHNAIMQSGSPFNPLSALDLNVVKVLDSQFAKAAGCADDKKNLITDPNGVVQCLKEKDGLLLANIEAVILEKQPYFFLPIYGDSFMPKNAIQALLEGDMKKTNVIIGNTKDEGAVFLHYLLPQFFTEKTAIPLDVPTAKNIIMGMYQNSTHPPPNAVADFYMTNVDAQNPQAILKAVYDSYGDFIFLCPDVFFAEKVQADAYYYLDLHRPSHSKWGEWMGTTHFDDVPFVFGDPMRSDNYTSDEIRFSFSIMQVWASFAIHGYPKASFEVTNAKWPKFTASNPVYKELYPLSSTTGVGPHAKACEFWRPYFNPAPSETPKRSTTKASPNRKY